MLVIVFNITLKRTVNNETLKAEAVSKNLYDRPNNLIKTSTAWLSYHGKNFGIRTFTEWHGILNNFCDSKYLLRTNSSIKSQLQQTIS